MGAVLTFIEQRQGEIKKSSLEVLSEAGRVSKQFGCDSYALILGNNVKNLAGTLGKYGAKKVYVIDNPKLEMYSTELYSKCVEAVTKQVSIDHIFLASTVLGKDLSAKIGGIFMTTVLGDAIEISIQDKHLAIRRPIVAGKAFLTVCSKKSPVIVTLRPNTFKLEENQTSPEIAEPQVPINEWKDGATVKKIAATTKGQVELTEAAIIVSGGRGLKGPENFHLRDQLAEVLGAAVGASRAVVDAGWRPYSEQVGQTGKTVSPNLYIALGISGAIQHLAGMGTSKVIVAINKDPDAPIFKVANYGIVGDVFDIVPFMCQELKKVISK